MPTDITHALPRVVADHVSAYNTHDPEALMATLATDALVNDVRREFLGHAAIRAWADKEIFFGPNVTLAVERAMDQRTATSSCTRAWTATTTRRACRTR